MNADRRFAISVTGPTGRTTYVRIEPGKVIETPYEDRATTYTTLEAARVAEAAHDKVCEGQSVCIRIEDLSDPEWTDNGSEE